MSVVQKTTNEQTGTERCHQILLLRGGSGSKIVQKRVTWYLNGPIYEGKQNWLVFRKRSTLHLTSLALLNRILVFLTDSKLI